MNRHKLSIIILIILTLPIITLSETEVAVFSNMQGTKASSMSGAFIGQADDSSAIYLNPAGLGLVGKQTWSIMNYHDFGMSFISTEFTVPFSYATFGFGYQSAYMGTFEEMRASGGTFVPTGGTFGYRGSGYFASIGVPIKHPILAKNHEFGVGITFKVIEEHMFNERTIGGGIDAGILWKAYFRERPYQFGLAFQNIKKPGLKWSHGTGDEVPLKTTVGLSTQLLGPNMTLNIDYQNDKKTNGFTSYGVDYQLSKDIHLFGGINPKGISSGLSLMIDRFKLGYSIHFANDGYLENLSKFSVTYIWPKPIYQNEETKERVIPKAKKAPEYYYEVQIAIFKSEKSAKNTQEELQKKVSLVFN